jgi:NTE family protein
MANNKYLYFGILKLIDMTMKRNVALVLSSGGARGCAHIGAINVLQEHGFRITSVAGTSMGALVGGIFATGRMKEFAEWISSLDIKEVLKLTDFSISRKGLVKGKKVIEAIKEIVPDCNIEDLEVPFCAVATDIIKGTKMVITKGKLYDAIRASISIPTVFQPFEKGGKYYVDGGLMNPIPVNRVKRNSLDILVVVDVNSPDIVEKKKKKKTEPAATGKYSARIRKIEEKISNLIPEKTEDDLGLFSLSNRSISLMMRKISDLTLEKDEPDILISIPKDSFSTYDFYKAKDIIKAGEEATLKALERYKLIIK